jgi:hypothetical protein
VLEISARVTWHQQIKRVRDVTCNAHTSSRLQIVMTIVVRELLVDVRKNVFQSQRSDISRR